MDLALYHPHLGYYARSPQRSGRGGDFFTSVDVSPLFGELLAHQIAEMAEVMDDDLSNRPFDFVEVGAGNGRLTADVLRAVREHRPQLYERMSAHLVEVSDVARAAQLTVLADVSDHVVSSSRALPESVHGVVLANELLDALPVHQVVMRRQGLREESDGAVLRTVEGPLSTPALASYFADLGLALEPGWRAEVNLRARQWIVDVAHRLARGFVMLIDYGHEAAELYSAGHAAGTLTAGYRHTNLGPGSQPGSPAWQAAPGEVDLTAHVDFTSVTRAGESAGLVSLGFLDQTYFLMGLALTGPIEASLQSESASSVTTLKRRLALKTLLLPGGLGSTFKVLMFGKDVGHPALKGCSYRVRAT